MSSSTKRTDLVVPKEFVQLKTSSGSLVNGSKSDALTVHLWHGLAKDERFGYIVSVAICFGKAPIAPKMHLSIEMD